MKLPAALVLLAAIVPRMNAVESSAPPAAAPAVVTLAPLPDSRGFAGMFAGVSGGALLCAGGANFPVKPLAQGGAKVWHGRVFVLATPAGVWRDAGRLPRASGYGVSATWRDAVALAGGGDARENFRDAWLMRWNGTALAFEALPPLPLTTANCSGAVVGDTLYVAGGQQTPEATAALRRCFALDLASPVRAWREIPWPAEAPGRILAVAAAHDGWFYLFSGADLFPNTHGQAERRYLTDAWRYRPATGWQRLADLPHAVAAAPSPAMEGSGARLLIAGGVWPEYSAAAQRRSSHPGFSGDLLAYNAAANTWTFIPAPGNYSPAAPPRVTAPLVAWQNLFVILSGEITPGVRTPTVIAFHSFP